MLKIMGPMMRGRLLQKGIPAGIKPPPETVALFTPPADITLDTAMARLKTVVTRFASEQPVPRNPMFGPMDKPQWEQFHCRHAELHFSFIVPGKK